MFGRNPRPNPTPLNPPSSAGSYNRIPSGRPEAYESRLSDVPRTLRSHSDISRLDGVAHAGSGGQEWQLGPAKSPGDQFTFGNMCILKMMSVDKDLWLIARTQSRTLSLRLPSFAEKLRLLHYSQWTLCPYCKAG